MEKLNKDSLNLVDANIERLKMIFPECVTDGKINFDTLKLLLGDTIDTSSEQYSFNWIGKKDAIRISQTPTASTLIPCKEKGLNWDSTKNIYIEGDNLEVLKTLLKTYHGLVNMIYIDPPYNTGHDFVYHDDFHDNITNYLENANQSFRANPDTAGRYHTDWLNMIYPRIKLAYELLNDHGTLFISIDNNEQANLEKICSSIFGEENVETVIWNKEAEGSSGTLKQISTIRRIHEYVICCYKNYDLTQFNKVREALKGHENDFQTANLAVNLENEKTNHPNYFTITNPSGDKFTRQWKWSKEEIDNLIKEDLIFWGSDGHKQPRLIIPTDERRKTFLLSILNYGGTTVGRKDFEELMGTEIEFSYPKPIILLKKLIETATTDDDLIMDFFSGSASTAQAVYQLNAECGTSRKFILVQLPELLDNDSVAFSEGYRTICDIGEERIRRASKKIYNDLKNKRDSAGLLSNDIPDPDSLDFGFKVFKLNSTCIRPWDSSLKYDSNSIFDLLDVVKEDRSSLDVAYEVMLKYGVFNMPLEEKTVNGKTVYSVGHDYMIISLNDEITTEDVTEIAKLQPKAVVFKEKGFATDSAKINADYTFKRLGIDNIKCI